MPAAMELEFLLRSEVLGSGLSDIKNADMEGQGDGSVGIASMRTSVQIPTAMSKPCVTTYTSNSGTREGQRQGDHWACWPLA